MATKRKFVNGDTREELPLLTASDAMRRWATHYPDYDIRFSLRDGAIVADAPDGQYWFRETFNESLVSYGKLTAAVVGSNLTIEMIIPQ